MRFLKFPFVMMAVALVALLFAPPLFSDGQDEAEVREALATIGQAVDQAVDTLEAHGATIELQAATIAEVGDARDAAMAHAEALGADNESLSAQLSEAMDVIAGLQQLLETLRALLNPPEAEDSTDAEGVLVAGEAEGADGDQGGGK